MRIFVALSIVVLAGPLAGCLSRPGPVAEFTPPRGNRSATVPATLTSGGRDARISSMLILGLN